MKTSTKILVVALGYSMVGLGRGLYIAHKYPAESAARGLGWWTRAALAWPYDAADSLISGM